MCTYFNHIGCNNRKKYYSKPNGQCPFPGSGIYQAHLYNAVTEEKLSYKCDLNMSLGPARSSDDD